MATSAQDVKNSYPLPVFYYEVKIDGMDPIAFSEVSGLALQHETITYRDGMSYKEGPKYMPGILQPINVSLKKGVMRGGRQLYDWINSIKVNTVEKKDILISLKDEADDPVVTWKVKDAFPTKMDAPAFSGTSNDVAIESLDLMATYLTIEYH